MLHDRLRKCLPKETIPKWATDLGHMIKEAKKVGPILALFPR